jgi:hypothetical protein
MKYDMAHFSRTGQMIEQTPKVKTANRIFQEVKSPCSSTR